MKSKNKFLDGNWHPVEETSAKKLKVSGEIPKELAGLFLRNGPNPKKFDEDNYHPFFGDGMIHGLRLENGQALWYRNRFVASPNGFGPNTHVMKHGNKIYALVEGGLAPVIMDKEMNFLDDEPFPFAQNKRFTAHPKVDTKSGEMHAISYDFNEYLKGKEQVHYVVIDKNGKQTKDQIIHLSSRPMVHDCAITENYILVFDLPVTFNLARREEQKKVSSGDYPVIWDEDHYSRVGLQSRYSDEITWIDVPKGFLFHIVNSYENEAGEVILDFCRYDRLFDFENPLPMGHKPFLTRWVINIEQKTCKETMLDDRSMEFSRVHPDLDGQEHQFGYMLNDGNLNRFFKRDFFEDKTKEHFLGENKQAAEPVFIPKKNAVSEDDGFVVGFVYDKTYDSSEFVIIDANNFSDEPLATVSLPQRVPFGFHGSWIDLD